MPVALKELARMAASTHTATAKPLTAAVVDAVKGAGLNDEEIKRVVEETNVLAFLDAFKKAGARKNVVFDGGPADPEIVLSQVKGSGLEMVCGEKTASAAVSVPQQCEPMDIGTKYAMLARQVSVIYSRVNELESLYEAAGRQLADASKLAMAAGNGGGEVLSAIKLAAKTEWGASVAQHEVRVRIGVAGEAVKTAGRLVHDHPLVLGTQKIEQLAYALRTTKQAAVLADKELRELLDEVGRAACQR